MDKRPQDKKPRYYLKPSGIFVIENYNFAKPFANFFPSIAGIYGIPMWVFYVNRGQAIASFGTKDKDHPLLEFFAANKAWQQVTCQGFRTFLKLTVNKKTSFYEPFHNGYLNQDFELNNKMLITSYDLTLKEENRTLGLEIEINYFTLPNDCLAALVRSVRIKNTQRKDIRIQLLDGLPQILPTGLTNYNLKKLGRTAEAWMRAKFISDCACFYKLDVDPTDRPEVIHIYEGNFYISFSKPIVDASTVFGPILSFDYPYHFTKNKEFKYPKNQIIESKTPAAMGLSKFLLRPDEEKILYSLFGHSQNTELLKSCLGKIKDTEYLLTKKQENKEIIEKLQSDIATQTSSQAFNFYVQQTYLDNIIRGGYPFIFSRQSSIVSGGIPPKAGKSKSGKQVFYLYSRKHGDLERDYNKFQISPTYFSQGNGNFRDIAQNRRCDIWFNPEIEEENLVTFSNLIQTDGFNPLIIKGLQFHLKDKDDFKKTLLDLVEEKDLDKILCFLDKPFTPGSVSFFIEKEGLNLKIRRQDFLNILMTNSIKEEDAQHGEGFWTDHWTYLLDLLEGYLEVYPERLSHILFQKRDFRFYDNVYVVRPRKEKYVLYEDKIRQLQSVIIDPEKIRMIEQRTSQAHWVRTDCGKGQIYQTTLAAKLICILINKLASLDPLGCGIEMEANKPNWYDALNGLPALFGSSSCETIELKRLVLFLKGVLEKQPIFLFEELYNFLIKLHNLLQNQTDEFTFWDESYSLKEEYRRITKLGISGKEMEISQDSLREFLDKALAKLNSAIEKAFDSKNNLYSAYFINEPAEYEIKDEEILIHKFIQKKLPLFLESQVHALKIEKDKARCQKLYRAVKKSELYDRKLKMYKVTARLSDMPFEIGRCRAFSRGWLENESIWLHMEYKYLLEVLEAGLYEEFYSEFKNILICFQNPRRYGRSILENCSFLVSSAFVDKNLHGNGFVARLSGSTVELIHIWQIINLGRKPFFLNERNELNLRFAPVLAGWLFKRDGIYSFNFLSSIKVIYHNPKRKNTFGKNAARIQKILFKDKDGKSCEISSDTIPHPYAQQIRFRQISQIEIFLDPSLAPSLIGLGRATPLGLKGIGRSTL